MQKKKKCVSDFHNTSENGKHSDLLILCSFWNNNNHCDDSFGKLRGEVML